MIDENNIRLDFWTSADGLAMARISLLSDPSVEVKYNAIGTRDDIRALGISLLKAKIREIHDSQTT